MNPFLEATTGTRPSFAWQSIVFGRELLCKGFKKIIGNGENTRVWTESWLFDGRMRMSLMKNPLVDLNLKVKELIDFQRRDWKMEVLNELFYPADVALITAKKPVVTKK